MVKRGKAFVPMKYSKIQASGSNTKYGPTSRYKHTSERFFRIASNADLKNFFYIEIHFEQNSDRHTKNGSSGVVFCGKDV